MVCDAVLENVSPLFMICHSACMINEEGFLSKDLFDPLNCLAFARNSKLIYMYATY